MDDKLLLTWFSFVRARMFPPCAPDIAPCKVNGCAYHCTPSVSDYCERCIGDSIHDELKDVQLSNKMIHYGKVVTDQLAEFRNYTELPFNYPMSQQIWSDTSFADRLIFIANLFNEDYTKLRLHTPHTRFNLLNSSEFVHDFTQRLFQVIRMNDASVDQRAIVDVGLGHSQFNSMRYYVMGIRNTHTTVSNPHYMEDGVEYIQLEGIRYTPAHRPHGYVLKQTFGSIEIDIDVVRDDRFNR